SRRPPRQATISPSTRVRRMPTMWQARSRGPWPDVRGSPLPIGPWSITSTGRWHGPSGELDFAEWAMDHAFGRRVLAAVWPAVLGEEPTVTELQIVAAISLGEGGYGRATYNLRSIPDGALLSMVSDSNNWGAVQAGKPPCRSDAFMATDTSPRLITQDNPRGY